MRWWFSSILWCSETLPPEWVSGLKIDFHFPRRFPSIAMDHGREGRKGHREYQDLLKTTLQRFSREKLRSAKLLT